MIKAVRKVVLSIWTGPEEKATSKLAANKENI
jgi:hypothetical protein